MTRMTHASLRNSAILLALIALAAAASMAMARSRTGPACTEQVGSTQPGFIALTRGTLPACIRVRLR